jgi:asparagine synthase (glutamine-hydrolysing)
MCGLNGLFTYHSAGDPPSEEELLLTRDSMSARGPDGAGAWWSADQRCGLGHRRLSILDLSERASQPMLSDDCRLAVVFNGEIYNYPSLRAELEREGTCLRTTSDTEILLHLYGRHGSGMVSLLRGMFAFAIWDGARGGLFLARDAFGIKPLYTSNDGWTFRFASQVKALLAGKRVSRDPEPAGLVGFHLFGSVPEPFTLYRDIRALPAGHTQWIDSAGPREPKPFLSLAAILRSGGDRPKPISQLRETLRDALRDSVRAHLLADVEVGVFLSAGVDSGALLGLMRDVGHSDIRAITLAFDEFRGGVEDEAPLAAQVAKHYQARHIIRRVGELEFQQDLPAILAAMDQPSIDGVNTWFIAKAAREVGLKVAISGLGGDELLAGYPSFVDLPRWRRRFGPFAAVPILGRLTRAIIKTFAPQISSKRPKALSMLEYSNSWSGVYLLRRALFLPHELAEIMDPKTVKEGLRRLTPQASLDATLVPYPGSDIAQVCMLETSHYMRNQLLRDADWAGMAHGLEIRVPLVDIALWKSLAPLIHGLSPGVGKEALASAPSKPLPTEISKRAKTGFAVPTGAWMNAAAGATRTPAKGRSEAKGIVSRRWSSMVIASAAQQ